MSAARSATMLTNETAAREKSDSTNRLKKVFEQSLVVLCACNDAGAKKTEIARERRSFLPIHTDAASLQKRALDEAAKALATLWKISEAGRTKPYTMGKIIPSS